MHLWEMNRIQERKRTSSGEGGRVVEKFLTLNQSFSFGSPILDENQGKMRKEDTKMANKNKAEVRETKW